MCGLGLLCVAPSVLMLVDHVIHLQVISCSVLFGFPLLWGGVHYLFREH